MLLLRTWGRSLALSAFSTLLLSGCAVKPPEKKEDPPPEVFYGTPTTQQVIDYEDFTGRTEAVKTVEVRARVTGYLQHFLFLEGTDVKENDVLFEIDDRPYKASLDMAVAEVALSQAQLAKAEADFMRARGTLKQEAISRSEYDIASAAYAGAKAMVGMSEAKRDQAKLNYEWTKVTAPISGQVSRRMVDPGNLVQADMTPLTTIVAAEKVYINFDVDERTLLRLRRLISDNKIQTRDQKQLKVYAALADEKRDEFPHDGVIDFSDNRVDPSTGTLRLRGLFENPTISSAAGNKSVRRIMSPGLFTRVRLPIGEPHEAMLIPEQAIGSEQGQKYVYTITDTHAKSFKNGKDEKVLLVGDVNKVLIVTGALHGRLREVEKGLAKDDRVIVSGIQRARLGKEKAQPKLSTESFQNEKNPMTPQPSVATPGVPGKGPLPVSEASTRKPETHP
jgi:multidrug efflux system membrane fusion protein